MTDAAATTIRLYLKGESEDDVRPEAERQARLLGIGRGVEWVVFYIRPRERTEHTPRHGATHLAWIGPAAEKEAFLVQVRENKGLVPGEKKRQVLPARVAASTAKPLGSTPQKKDAGATEVPAGVAGDAAKIRIPFGKLVEAAAAEKKAASGQAAGPAKAGSAPAESGKKPAGKDAKASAKIEVKAPKSKGGRG